MNRKKVLKKYGARYTIKVLPDGRIIDGYHMWKILGENAPYEIIDLPEEEAFELGIVLNTAKMQLSPE
ncbi:MAG: hypothetical protein M1388_03275 [Thaumarchaeota archaeon]|nr:hypothetical protein [Nitrososphaerota archaeon]